MSQLRRRVPDGGQDSFFNNTGSSIAAKKAVKKTTTANYIALVAAVTDPVLGVTVNAIPDQTWGLVQTRGQAIMTADGTGVTAGDQIMSSAGLGTTWTAAGAANANMVGLANTTAAASADFEVELAGPAVFKQG